MRDTDHEYRQNERFLVKIKLENGQIIYTGRFSLRKSAKNLADKYNALRGATASVIDTKENVKNGD